MPFNKIIVLLVCASISAHVIAAPSVNGETGLIAMPDGRIAEDGEFRIGGSYADPYKNWVWSSISLLPRFELSARYTEIGNVDLSQYPGWSGFGDYKDKVSSAKFLLAKESWAWPSIAFGIHDLHGTGLFEAKYLAASKRFGDLDATLGYGSQRIEGLFAGMRYRPDAWNGLALVAEYDAMDYPSDKFAAQTGLIQRDKGVGLGVEYQWGWLGSQLAWRDGDISLNAYASVPLQQKEFVPKLDEPAPDMALVARPSYARWRDNPEFQQALLKRLLDQDFKQVHLETSQYETVATLTNSRISLPSRAVGRAVRSILLRAPLETRQITVHYTIKDMAFASYTFFDVARLRQYFQGGISRQELAAYVSVDYANPAEVAFKEELMEGLEQEYYQTYLDGDDGDMLSFRAESAALSRIRIAPGLGIYFNDPSGAFRYEVFASASMQNQLATGLFLDSAAQLTVYQNISEVTQPSNSVLPHVRTDIADYKKNGNAKLTRLMLNQYFQPEQRVYARVSGGLYEEMFGGVGGQLLYYPESSPWAVDLAVDALKQRDVGGGLDFRDYSTVTALASLHYRLPVGVTATLRAGRFLAKDEGARFEFKRRFRSGFEVGAWYTVTNGNDITTPGSPEDPYHDKGVFMSIPLAAMLTRDTSSEPKMSISPWTRDVGQMVRSPGDLYAVLEPGYRNVKDHDGLQYFGDYDDSYALPEQPTLIDRLQWDSWAKDRLRVIESLQDSRTWLKVGAGLGVAALTSLADNKADRWALRHRDDGFNQGIAEVGNHLPLLVGGTAAFLALDGSNQRLSATSFTALEAGVLGMVASETGKYVFGRSRPEAGKGDSDFNRLHRNNGNSSFPSGHTTAVWAMLTPYAKEYNAPWLYGVAALTNMARVADRKHWVSDTVAGAVLGYFVGDALWRWHKEDGPRLGVQDNALTLTWETH